ncbi:MAG: hypothetical protein ACKOCU_14210, partial [Betaproteobacteria bacterium]
MERKINFIVNGAQDTKLLRFDLKFDRRLIGGLNTISGLSHFGVHPMCGIVGAVSQRNIVPTLIEGL